MSQLLVKQAYRALKDMTDDTATVVVTDDGEGWYKVAMAFSDLTGGRARAVIYLHSDWEYDKIRSEVFSALH